MTRAPAIAAAFLFIVSILPASASRPLTIAELEQQLQALHGKSDADAAWAIADLRPAERIDASTLARLQQQLPGEKSRSALQAFADESAFLDPPASDIPNRPPPDVAEQRRIMGLVVAYVGKTIPQLPNFLATRDVQHFEDTPQVQRSDLPFIPYQPLHFVGSSQTAVLYQDGREDLRRQGPPQNYRCVH